MLGNPAKYGDVELSPDGRRVVASVLDPALNTRNLWVFDPERGVRQAVSPSTRATMSHPSGRPTAPRCSSRTNRGGHFNLYRKSVDGVGAETPVFADASEKYPTSWTPDGRTAVFWSFDADRAGLSLLPLAGEQRPSSMLDGFANAGRVAPDGQWLAYHWGQSGVPEVYVVPFPSASRRWQVSSAGRHHAAVARRRQGDLLRFARQPPDGGVGGGEGRRAGARNARPLFEAQPVGPRSFFAVSPDGQRFLVNSLPGDGRSSITLVQNWSAASDP